jgi:predicted DsbA family dithiol-disulfide isomerase
MLIEIYSDVVCPWCYIGRRRLQQALRARPELRVELRWLPFELNPDIPPQGVDRAVYLASKFGDLNQLKAMHEQMRSIGAQLGIAFRFELIGRTPNTRAAHALLELGALHGRQTEILDTLFRAYFEEGRDIGDTVVLEDIAASQGLGGSAVTAALHDEALRAQIVEYEKQAAELGISGVPTFIFERRYAVSGAQEPAVLIDIFDRIRAAA